jgi:hypothetical protein
VKLAALIGSTLITALTACSSADPGPDAGADGGGGLDGATSRDGGGADAASGRDASTQDAGPPALDPCPTGSTLHRYALTPLPQLPPIGALELTGFPAAMQLVSPGTTERHEARLDVCEDAGGQRTLQGVMKSSGSFGGPSYYQADPAVAAPVQDLLDLEQGYVNWIRLPPAAFRVSGLEAALAGDLDPLAVRILHDQGLLILGHPGFIAIAEGQVGPSSIQYNSIYINVGGLAPGDPFAGLPCRYEETLLSQTFRIATAMFEVEGCSFLGGGATMGYRFTSFAITDRSPELDPAERARFAFEGAAEIEAVLNYRWNHHNACDSFYLTLPHAEYAATTSPSAGCGMPVPGAPPRDFNDMDGTVHYKIRYHGGAWTEGTTPGCAHYLFCP